MNNISKVTFVIVVAMAVFAGKMFIGTPGMSGDFGGGASAATGGEREALLASSAGIVDPETQNPVLVSPSETRSMFYRSGTEPTPVIAARAALIADLDGTTTYLSLNADGRWPLASITKLMTAAVVLRTMDQNEILPLGSEAYSVRDLLRMMLLLSKNEAAEALATAYGRDAFIAEMNQLAAEWHLLSTHFSDPTGLSVANQSTPENIRAMTSRIFLDYPDIPAITRTKNATIQEMNSKKKVSIAGINQFGGRSDFLGGKTGYTDEADGNLVSVFSYSGKPVFIVVLGTGDRFAETLQLFEWFKRNFRATN